ncbi:acyltransferase family protein [Erythrobacter sp. LQ02-29]|uniref:acyltransferase family protein n=1 Tax=Erythrobacter sp. LQ02-29 TaxID=2920384 RepID=UPI001F4DBC90|nr:acyltransferase family protein [Erythrobacter sp. LQ02-29]MCP9222062.1 acyltransferase family protein [Erythrobacter sp. LQ02-29]
MTTLEMARGIAALCVVAFNANVSAGIAGAATFRWMDGLAYAVDFFFVLSGFLVMRAYRRDIGVPRAIGPYLAKRTIRAFPMLWLAVLAAVAAQTAIGSLVEGSTIARSLVPYPSLEPSIPDVVWALRHGLLFYCGFALLILSRRMGAAIGAVCLMLVLAQLLAAVEGSQVGGLTAFFLSAYQLDFVFGIALSLIHRERVFRRSPVPLLAGLAAMVVYLAFRENLGLGRLGLQDYTSPGATLGVAIMGAIFGLILHGLLRMEGVRLPRAFIALGGASYLLYLIHGPLDTILLSGIRGIPPNGLSRGLVQVGLIAAAIAISLPIHYFVEKPLLVRSRKWMDGGNEAREPIKSPMRTDGEETGTPQDRYRTTTTLNPDEKTVGWFSRIFRNDASNDSAGGDTSEPFDEEGAESRVHWRLAGVPSQQARNRDRRARFPQFAAVAAGSASGHAAIARLGRAFTPSHPISDPDLFAGRHDILARLIDLIELQGLHVVLYGDRGIGKTSILRMVSDLAENANYRVVYASCGSDTTFDSLMRSQARKVPLLFHRDYGPTSTRVEEGQTFADELGEGPVTVADMTSLLEKLDGTQLLIVIDEFDRVESERMREQLAELIKNLSDRNVTIQFLIAGVASNLNSLISHIPSIRRNLTGLQVDPLGAKEVEELLQNGAAKSGVGFDDKARERLIGYSQGLPYLAQLLGLHASVAARQDGRDIVTEPDIVEAGKLAAGELRLRVSAKGVRAVQAAADRIGWTTLGEVAGKAMQSLGMLDEPALSEVDEATKSSLFETAPEELKTGNAPEWQFVEEALAPYIWLESLDGDRSSQLPGARVASGQLRSSW